MLNRAAEAARTEDSGARQRWAALRPEMLENELLTSVWDAVGLYAKPRSSQTYL
jgi:hypothetical protein